MLVESSGRYRPPTQAYLKSELPHGDPTTRLLEIFFERVPAGTDSISVSLFEQIGSPRLVGSVRIPIISQYRPSFISLDLEDLGSIDFIQQSLGTAAHRLSAARLGGELSC